MDSDPADTVCKTDIDVGATDASDQPNPVVNKNADSATSERPSAIERQRAAMESWATRNAAVQYAQPSTPGSGDADFDPPYDPNGSHFGRRSSLALLLIAVSLLLVFGAFLAVKKETVPEGETVQITKALKKIPGANAGGVNASDVIAVPMREASLSARPEFLQQLVAIYRSRLVTNPNDAEATTVLSRMREQSLAELDAISSNVKAPRASEAATLAVKLFPELANNPRYRSIAARISAGEKNIAQSRRLVTAGPVVATQQPAPAASPATSTQVAQPPTPESIPTTQPAGAVVSRKPQVRVISMTPGIIRKDRFVPREGGNIFRLKIGYRHRDNPLVDQPGSGLVAQLSESGSSKILAEVPVEIEGSSGEKSFLIGTFKKSRMDKFYKLTFIVDGQVLPSHTVLLSR